MYTAKNPIKPLILLVLVLLSFVQAAYAQPPKTITTPNGIAYMSGGIGEEEVLEMRLHAKKFTLNLLFSEGTSGRWVTDVNVNVYNQNDERVFRIVGAKPLLYINLPAGTYTILANNNGEKLRHKLTIEDSVNQKVILNWKDTVEEDMPLDGQGN